MASDMTDTLTQPYWQRVPGLGDWVRLVDLARFRAPTKSRAVIYGHAVDIRRFLQERGCKVQRHGRQWYVRRKDLKHMAEWGPSKLAGSLRVTASLDDIADLDSPDFAGMDLVDVFREIEQRGTLDHKDPDE